MSDLNRIYAALFWVSFNAFILGLTLGAMTAGRHVPALLLVIVFLVAINAWFIKSGIQMSAEDDE